MWLGGELICQPRLKPSQLLTVIIEINHSIWHCRWQFLSFPHVSRAIKHRWWNLYGNSSSFYTERGCWITKFRGFLFLINTLKFTCWLESKLLPFCFQDVWHLPVWNLSYMIYTQLSEVVVVYFRFFRSSWWLISFGIEGLCLWPP